MFDGTLKLKQVSETRVKTLDALHEKESWSPSCDVKENVEIGASKQKKRIGKHFRITLTSAQFIYPYFAKFPRTLE